MPVTEQIAGTPRQTTYNPVSSTSEFDVGFVLFDDDDLTVLVDGSETTAYTVTSTYSNGRSLDAVVTLNTAVSGVSVVIKGAREPRRETAKQFAAGAAIAAETLNTEFNRAAAERRELYDLLLNGDFNGWTPEYAVESDSARRVLKVVDWTGGTGTKPAVDVYVAADGFSADIADGVDIRGPAGAAGAGTGDLLAANNLSDVDDAPTAAANLGLEIGSDVQAYSGVLAAVAAVTAAANKILYFTGAAAAAVSDLTSFSRGLLALTDAAAWRSALGISGSSIPTGTMFDYAGSSAPSGYLLCYGQAVSRTTYADLFSLLGTSAGAGDGSTTFNLPDYRGRVGVGKDDMGGSGANRVISSQKHGVDGTTLFATGGVAEYALTEAELAAHDHLLPFKSSGSGGVTSVVTINGNTPGTISSSDAGGDEAHTNMQPFIIVTKIIKT